MPSPAFSLMGKEDPEGGSLGFVAGGGDGAAQPLGHFLCDGQPQAEASLTVRPAFV